MGVATHNIEYLCLNLFTLRRFNNNESSGSRQIRYGATGGDAPRLQGSKGLMPIAGYVTEELKN